ncbi:MAG TPA: 23S rRNA pseudouridine(1911/1915/1917) synthase RluD [Burkholderiales bacterium]|nr:23S rRNA pseudouridine(1911/1915/1917) synthase RluD [Burkholderiales bacterium]
MPLEKNPPDYSGKPGPETGPRSVEPTIELRVPGEMTGLRLDQALARLLPAFSRSRLQHWVRHARVTVDGAAAAPKDKVWGGERIEVRAERDPATRADEPQEIALAIVHEDAQLLVIDKPAGLVVHPGSGNPSGTLLNALLHHAPSLAALPRAGIVHRLDKDTSGLLVVAKTLEAHTSLVRQLQSHSVRREYVALVVGVPSPQGRVEAPIGRHPVARTRMAVVARGRPALTHFRVMRARGAWSLVRCRLETGRTHQIRVHMHSIGHPLIGDPVYGTAKFARALPEPARNFRRQALHAARLELTHPASGQRVTFHAPLPADLAGLLAGLEHHACSV